MRVIFFFFFFTMGNDGKVIPTMRWDRAHRAKVGDRPIVKGKGGSSTRTHGDVATGRRCLATHWWGEFLVGGGASPGGKA